MRLVQCREIPEDANLRKQWNELVLRSEQPQVFYTWEWAFAVQSAYKASLQPLLFLAYDDHDALCGVAALGTDSGNKRGLFLCATTGDYCDILSSAQYKAAFLSEMLAELRKQGNHDFTLTNLPADSDTVAALQQASSRNGYHCFMRTAYECAQVSFDRLERGKDGKPVSPGKKRVRRFAKAMVSDGTLQVDHNRSWEEVAPILPQLIKAHVVRFLEIGRISNLANARRQLFLENLSKLLSESDWVVLSRMSVGARVYAWHYGFQFHDNWFWYQPTFDSSVEKHWPGFCLLTEVIEDAIENPALTKLDLGLGSEAYKAKFANASRRTLCVTLHRSLLKHWWEIIRYRSVAAVTASSGVERVVRSLSARAGVVLRRTKQSGLRATLGWLASRIGNWTFSREEVLFFERNLAVDTDVDGSSLRPINYELLADAAMRYFNDKQTLQYLLRSAARLRERNAEGFALVDNQGRPVHFAWATNFDGFFLSELSTTVDAPAADCVMLFDCWTPAESRGRGYFGRTISLVAQEFQKRGKKPWIFSASSNQASLHGLQKAGFQRRYSLMRWRVLGQRIKGEAPKFADVPAAEVPARVG